MKTKLSILLIILCTNLSFAQNTDYNKLWKEIEQLELDGLPKSALKLVENISDQAKTSKNATQEIKSLIYKSKFSLILEEDAQLKIIAEFKTEITSSEFPVKNVLESILANLYWQYFQQNRYKFYNRTKTSEKVDKTDFRTWDLQTLFQETHALFQRSLQNGLMLQLEALRNYDEILLLAKDSQIYRPTLFDFLSHNALDFYKTNETHITRPSYKFEIDTSDYLADSKTFSKLTIESQDTTSLQLEALKIYKDLISFHIKDKEPFALTDVNIERLKFVKQYATFENKDAVFLNTLKAERNEIAKHDACGLYAFEIASHLYEQGRNYQPKRKENLRWNMKAAFDICNGIIKQFPKSKAAEKCAVLKQKIQEQTLQITTEEVLPIQTYSRLLVRYKNIDTLNLKLYKLTEREFKKFNNLYRKEEQLSFINKLRAHKDWFTELKNENDYQTHSTEILVPKLDNGRYLVFAKNNKTVTTAFSTIQVTNLALVERSTESHHIYQIINRNNGSPILNTDVTVNFYINNSKNASSKNYKSNSRGEVIINKDQNRYRNLSFEIRATNDTAIFGNYYINKLYKKDKETTTYKSFLFTDRSIYRPGQVLYYKGIAMKTYDGKSEVLANHNMYITLYDANEQEIKELKLTTNAFGSVSGEFILPNTGLTGQYLIALDSETEDVYTDYYFSVEEYKRPKFETSFTPVTKTFKVNDSVTLKGQALAYAGSYITDAKVVYRVHRKVEYPRWYFWYRPWINFEPQEIAHGETITNKNGEYEITFKALPDQSIDKSSLPVFNYEITADVTDLNGETRSATTIAKVGYHVLLANMHIKPALDKTKKDHKIILDTKNLNDEFVPATGTIKIYKLQAPNAVLRNRPWASPDYQVFSKDTFKTLFPNDAYKNEHIRANWKKGALVFEKNFDTKTSKTLDLGNIKRWSSGEYLITLESKDKFDQLVKNEIKTSLYSANDKTVADNQLFSISTDKSTYKEGDQVILSVGSAANNLNVTLTIEKDHKIINTYVILLNNNKKTISIPVNKDDVGGFAVNYSFAAYNSYKTGSEIIAVPYPNTDLNIETETFRDKLQPGQDETWRFKIKGTDSDKVSAELLASMYDASLDQFKSHHWDFKPRSNPLYDASKQSSSNRCFGTKNFRIHSNRVSHNYNEQNYDKLNWFGFRFRNETIRIRGNSSLQVPPTLRAEAIQIIENDMEVEEVAFAMNEDASLDEVVVVGYGIKKETNTEQNDSIFNNIQIRKNLQETAFFFPHLHTDEYGHISFSFTAPEALTQWKLQLLAHTKSLESTTKNLTTLTQKELMVIPNAPRFLRQGDNITISTKISNLTENLLSGQAILLLTDAINGDKIDAKLSNINNSKSFTVDAKGNKSVSWNVTIPDDIDAIQYTIIAESEDSSDGEQNALPVLSNRQLVSETLPMWVRSNETRTFTLDKLKTNTSSTLKHHKLTLEITSNPAWYAVQALPYLMEYPYECNEQTFSRYYANALANHIVNSNPRIKEVFNQWQHTDALLSNLEKNEELKSILIQETPWLRDAQNETEQKKRIALLFDLNKMNNEMQTAITKLDNSQMTSGAWAWFNGGRENRYITQHIISGFGHLNKLGVNTDQNSKMIENAINYLDTEFVKEYHDIKKYHSKVDLSANHLTHTQLHYLYMRSFYPDIKKSKKVEEIMQYYLSQVKKYWLKRSLYTKGLLALISERFGDKITAAKIIKSLKENSIISEELGMYWKKNTNSWYWYQAPIETQALLIEAFSEIDKDTNTIDNLKIWLLKNKQTNQWKTTKATTEAVYALLLQGSDWLSVNDAVDVVIGNKTIDPSKLENVKVEAGTGYYKTSWSSSDITSEMAQVTLTKKADGIAWGSLYWQYFEDLDNITSSETPLKLKKKLFLKTNTDTGEEISEITSNTLLKVGDLVRVRIELRSDRGMEFVHMKDMRAAGLEPVNVLSQYKWQDGLGYYESTKDASTNFFFDYLPKGIFIFEYDLRVNNAGNMSNGITTIQSMYAPEFSSHSEGTRILVE
jgi:uncharacterized protein YfaS (alpha-2-macroglobulin family)